MNHLKFLVFLLVLQTSLVIADVHAQERNDVKVYGTVTDFGGGPVLGARTVVAIDTNNVSIQIVAKVMKPAGFEMLLPAGKVYRLNFDAVGYVQKHVVIDLLSPVVPFIDAGYSSNITLSLFRYIEGLDYAPCLRPLGVSRYNSDLEVFRWDFDLDRTKPTMKELTEAYQAATTSQQIK